MTQRFATTSIDINETNTYVSREETIADVQNILNGTCDKRDPQSLMYIKTLNDLPKSQLK